MDGNKWPVENVVDQEERTDKNSIIEYSFVFLTKEGPITEVAFWAERHSDFWTQNNEVDLLPILALMILVKIKLGRNIILLLS